VQWHALQVPIELIAQVAHHTLSDHVVQIGLSHTDDPRNKRGDYQNGTISQQQRSIALWKSIINDAHDYEGAY
jgi:hypothetical protein